MLNASDKYCREQEVKLHRGLDHLPGINPAHGPSGGSESRYVKQIRTPEQIEADFEALKKKREGMDAA